MRRALQTAAEGAALRELPMIDRVIALIERETGEKVTAETKFDSLGIDSLDFLELILQVQNEFSVSISDAQIANLNTVSDLVNAISG